MFDLVKHHDEITFLAIGINARANEQTEAHMWHPTHRGLVSITFNYNEDVDEDEAGRHSGGDW